MTKLSEIKDLTITETEDLFISSPGHCQFCQTKIQWVRCKGWISDDEVLAHEFPFTNLKSSMLHICKQRLTGWAKQDEIPKNFEYYRPDDDDDTACFVAQKYTDFI